jgi:hypothetical protein
VSHAIERAALAAAEDGPMAVVALFQRMPYLDRERAVYERIAERAGVTVMGVVGADPRVDQPAGTVLVPLSPRDPLAREWTVLVLTPRFGAVLVALDQERVDPAAPTLEAGRLFEGHWSVRRDDALHELLRLRQVLGTRLPAATVAALDDVVARVREMPATPGESRADAMFGHMVSRGSRTGTAPRDAEPRFATSEEVRAWSGESGVTASGVLPVALVGVRVPEAHQLPAQAGRRTAAVRDESMLTLLSKLGGDAGRVTRVAEDEFLLLVPGLSDQDAVSLAYQVGAELREAANAFLPATATVAVTVTRRRPLPTGDIHQALQWAVAEGIPVARVNEPAEH